MPRKVFTAGEVLAAADVNEFLMDQAVQSFAGTAARGSAISSPVEGMYTHLEDTDSLQFWNGSAWTTAALATGAGLVHLRTETFTGVNFVSLGSNADPVFSSLYDDYKILFTSTHSTTANRTWTFRLRANTTDESGGVYNFANIGRDANNVDVNSNGFNQTSARMNNNIYYPGVAGVFELDIRNPFAAKNTTATGHAIGVAVDYYQNQLLGFGVGNTNSYNGFTVLNSSGDFVDGQVSVYGYRKA
jgi:hypothetical protein